MFSVFADWMFAGKFRAFKLGRPAKSRPPTSVISMKLTVLRFWRLFRPKVPPIDEMLSAEMEVTLVAPVAVRSPVIFCTLGKTKSPAASVAMATLPEKVEQEERALASAGLTTVRVAVVLHCAVETLC